MSLVAVHQAIHNRLESRLKVLEIDVFDYLPRTVKPPLVVLGKMQFNYNDNLASADGQGSEVIQKIHIITRTQEKIQALEILKVIENALEPDLDIEGSFLMKQKINGGFVEETEDELFYIETDLTLWIIEEEKNSE